MSRPLSKAQLECLSIVSEDGSIDRFYQDGGGKLHGALWFNAADKVVESLKRRGLVTSDGRLGCEWELTDAGRAALPVRP